MDELQHLAINVLGYTIDESVTPSVYIKNESGATLTASNFDPKHKITQAISIIKTFKRHRISTAYGVTTVDIWNNSMIFNGSDKLIEKAITEAALQASGWKGD